MAMIKNKTYLPLTSVNKGFSLIELIIIMTIIGIMIAASTTRIKDITINARVSAAINQITADIDQAKTMSMSMRKQIEIIFNQTNETYTVYKDGNVFNDFPGSNNGTVNLSDNNNFGVDITSVNLNGSNVITFTKYFEISGLFFKDSTLSLSAFNIIFSGNEKK